MRIDWREHLRRVELPGAEVNYVEMGEGEPIVFVHGLSGCWQNWLENLPHFARSHRVIALDLPGFGESPMPSWPIEIPAYGRLLHDFCEKLGIAGSATLVGNSMGGFVATEAVIDAPGRFDRLVLVSAAGITYARARNEPAAMLGRLAQMSGPVLARFNRAGPDPAPRPLPLLPRPLPLPQPPAPGAALGAGRARPAKPRHRRRGAGAVRLRHPGAAG